MDSKEQGRKMIETAMVQTCSACPARPYCRVKASCFNRFMVNLKMLLKGAEKWSGE